MSDEHSTTPSGLSPLQRAFLALEEARARVAALEAGQREPIAIVGVGCRVPGADDPGAFWQLLESGVDATGDVPADRWNADGYYDPDPEAEGRITTRRGGFLRQVDHFDAEFFGIAPREAQGLDPQQRLLLEVSWEALEDAGLAADRLEGSATGVYVGMASSDYWNDQLKTGDPALLNPHFVSGVAHSMASGRLSYLLGLQGPSITLDTACSSSLVALHLACQALQAGECSMALAGGVNIMIAPELAIALSHSRMLAPDGRCKTFDAAADGFARGEGCGIVVLKRLRDAVADGSRILAVVRGSAVNQDGPSSGLTAPNGPAQEAVIREALRRARLEPGDVGYVEAHGTGTQLGDPLEMGALGNVFGSGRDPALPLVVGSVKTNLGHLEAAAGITSVIKVVLALRARTIPPHLHFRTPSPHIAWDEWPVRVPTEAASWQPIRGRRIAGISSFGFSGTNAHVVLEEGPDAVPAAAATVPANLLVLSARDDRALRELAARHARVLATGDAPLASWCLTAATGRASLPQRAVITASSREEMTSRLAALAAGREDDGLRTTRVARRDPPRIAFLFTGQGAQYPGMGLGLYELAPAFRAALDRCAAVLDPLLGRPLLALLREQSAVLDETRFTQPTLFAVEYALTELWRRAGVEPVAVMGHSVGEYVAACVAGILSLEDALRLVVARGQLMQSLPPGGAMMAIFAPEDAVSVEVRRAGAHVSVAAVNAPGQVVISGPSAGVAAIGEVFLARGVRCQALAVSHAFHSPLVDPVLDEFERVAQGVAYGRAQVRLVSNLTGQPASGTDATSAGYWRRHMREGVRFADGIRSLAALRPDVVIEVGPHPTLLSFAEMTLGTGGPVLIPTLRRNRTDWVEYLNALGALFLQGARIDWRRALEGSPGGPESLPTYPFQRSRHWFGARPGHATRGGPPGHPLLGLRVPSPLPQAIYQSVLAAREPAFLQHHVVQGQVVVPATAWLELLRAAGAATLPGKPVAVADVTVQQAMLLDDGVPRRVQAIVEPVRDGAAEVRVSSQPDGVPPGDAWDTHVTARVVAAGPMPAGNLDQARARCPHPMDVRELYQSFSARGLGFGESFRTIDQLQRGEGQALGRVVLQEGDRSQASSYGIHPVLLDGCLQVLAAAMPDDPEATLYLPVGIGRFTLSGQPGTACWSHASLRGTPGQSAAADVLVLDDAGRVVAALEDVRLARVSADTIARLGSRWLDDAMLEVEWRDVAGSSSGAPAWSPAQLASGAGASLPGLRRTSGLDDYDAFLPRLDALCLDYVVNAMGELGWTPRPGDVVSSAALAGMLGVTERHQRLFARLLEILAEGGWLEGDGTNWVVQRELATQADIGVRHRAMLDAHPHGRAELEVTGRAGAGLADALRGTRDPMDLLFPGGSIEGAERLYRDSPPARVMNGMMARVVADAATAAPPGRPLRILEIGAGTGGTTAHLLPVLGQVQVEYTFTDVGPLFVARARERFASMPGMRFGVLDLERNLVEQGFPARHFDLVVASNVVHATRDLRQSLARIHEVLAPGGLLALLEVTAPQRWFDLTVGLTPGWWAFEDHDLRPRYPAIPREDWLSLLESSGFDHAASVPNGSAPPGVLGLQALLLAQARQLAPFASRTWLLLADEGGTLGSLAASLRARGDRCIVVRRGADFLESGDDCVVDPANPAHLERLLERHPGQSPLSGVMYGWSLDAAMPAPLTPVNLAHASGFVGALHLAQALLRTGKAPRLWIVTRGGQPAGEDDAALEPLQATAWGLGRTLLLEHPELRPTVVDLDSTQPHSSVAALEALLDEPLGEPQVAIRAGSVRGARLVRRRKVQRAPTGPWRLAAPDRNLDNLQRLPLERALPGPGFVEIEVAATGLNFKDVLNALGLYPGDPGPLGSECAGRVVAVGPGVSQVAVGDDVVALAAGSLASHVLARADFVLPRPAGMSHDEAATFPIAFLTAHYCLEHVAHLRRGQRVLIHAAAGGVGMAAVRIAQRIGAEVHATAGAPWKKELLRSLGVRHVYDSRSTAFADQVLAATGGAGVDVVLNSLSGEMIEASFRALARGGVFVEIGKRGLWTAERVATLGQGHQYHVVDWGDAMRDDPALVRGMFRQLLSDVEHGAFSPLPRHAFPAERCGEAFRFMARARHAGRIAIRHGTPGMPVSSRGTYLVTGGLSGLGLVMARYLAKRGAGRLVLVGRRGAPPEAMQLLEELRLITTVEVAALDVADEAGLAALLERLRESGPPLRGVIHSAGVVEDAAILSQDTVTVAAAFAPKVAGATLLDRLTRVDPLDFFVLFSSVAGVLGSPGQANHAGANAFLDLLAARRRADGLPGLSVAWGPWAGVGAAADRDMSTRLSELGLATFTADQGLQALERAMAEDLVQVVVQPADWRRVLDGEPGRAALLSELAGAGTASNASPTAPVAARGLREELVGVPAVRAQVVIAAHVRARALKALGLDPDRVLDPGTPLGELGLDSLLAVELRNTLGTDIGRTLPATLLFDYPTVETLTGFLAGELGVEDAAPAVAAAAPGVVDAIEELSDEEVERRLAARARKR